MPSHLTWPEARALALAGTRVRRADWETEWLSFGTALWFIGEENEAARVVQAEDFTSAEWFATDWTTEPWEEPDPCDRPPRKDPFFPPSLSVAAEVAGDDLTISPVVGAGTFGAYRLIYLVNGEEVAVGAAASPGTYPKTVTIDVGLLEAPLSVQVRAESVLPLPAWSHTATCSVVTIICIGMPTGDCVFEITKAEYKRFAKAGIWRVNMDWTGGETHTAGGGGGSQTTLGAAYQDDTVGLACGVTLGVSFPGQTSYFGFPSGGLEVSGSIAVAATINFGMVAGLYYAGVTLTIDGGTWDSDPTPGTGFGTIVATLGDHAIPMESRWTPGYSGYSGYVNDIVVPLSLDRLPG